MSFSSPSPRRHVTVAWKAALLSLGTCVNLTAQEIPRAVPVDEVPRAVPVTEPNARPPRTEPSAPAPERRTGPDEDLYEYATLCFSQKDYQIAIKPLSDYVTTYPQGRHAAEAWFRLAECYRNTTQHDLAKRTYGEVITRHGRTESAASAAYRLGAYAYEALDFKRAATHFETCARLTSSAPIKLAASYNTALCYKQAGDKKKALTAFEAVAAIKENNQYRENALLEVANASLEAGRKTEALDAFQDILSTSKDPKIQGDALLRAGLLLNEQEKSDEAIKNFKRVLSISGISAEQQGIAVFGLIQGYFKKADYDSVITTYSSYATTLPPVDLRSKMLLLVGNAQKLRQAYSQAVQTFILLEKNYPDTPEALEAGYMKLLCFHSLNDKDLPSFAENFEQRYAPKYAQHDYLVMSRLIRADWWFAKGDHVKSAEAFGAADMAKVPKKVRASVLYKKGFAETEAGKYNEAIASLTAFLTEYPQDANVPVALAQRGLANRAVRSFDKALADFTAIIQNHSSSAAVEMAYYQSGMVKGETRDLAGMVADFEALLKKFPNTAAASEVNFRIGRGYFDMKRKDVLPKAIEALRKTVSLDKEQYLDRASQLMIACQWLLEDVDAMAKEVDTYLQNRKDASINPKALIFLGDRLYRRKEFRASAHYLNKAVTPDTPETTEAPVWSLLGMAELENRSYENALKALDFYLNVTPDGEGRPRALWGKGRAFLGLGRYDDAETATSDGLKLMKEGRLKAQLQILDGDISIARGDALSSNKEKTKAEEHWKKGAGNYLVVSQFFVDPEITPRATWKAIGAFEKIGDKKRADDLKEQLKSKYPNYVPKDEPAPPPPVEAPAAPTPDPAVVVPETAPAADAAPKMVPPDGTPVPAPAPAPTEPVIPKAEPVEDDEPIEAN